MARPVYSQSLVQLHAFTGTYPFVVPAGKVLVIRDIDAFNASAPFTNAHFDAVNSVGGSFAHVTVDAPNVDGQLYSWRGRQVFNYGEVVGFVTDADFDITVSGYLLDTP